MGAGVGVAQQVAELVKATVFSAHVAPEFSSSNLDDNRTIVACCGNQIRLADVNWKEFGMILSVHLQSLRC